MPKFIPVAIIVTIITVISLITLSNVSDVKKLGNNWTSYKHTTAIKSELIIEIQGNLGFGGMIHQFKNYILRQDKEVADKVERYIKSINTSLSKYVSLGLSSDEKAAINDIQAVVQQYNDNLIIAKDLVENKATPKYLDSQVKINDTPALHGLLTLTSILHNATKQHSKQIGSLVNEISFMLIITTPITLLLILITGMFMFIRRNTK
jgi:methyl-accepting chemotaxis protein